MNGLDVLIILFTAFYAFAVGRNIFFWTFLSAFYGFWIPLLLLIMPKREPRAVVFPQWLLNWFGPKYVNRTIKKMEGQF
jgi:hypothetical protein